MQISLHPTITAVNWVAFIICEWTRTFYLKAESLLMLLKEKRTKLLILAEPIGSKS